MNNNNKLLLIIKLSIIHRYIGLSYDRYMHTFFIQLHLIRTMNKDTKNTNVLDTRSYFNFSQCRRLSSLKYIFPYFLAELREWMDVKSLSSNLCLATKHVQRQTKSRVRSCYFRSLPCLFFVCCT